MRNLVFVQPSEKAAVYPIHCLKISPFVDTTALECHTDPIMCVCAIVRFTRYSPPRDPAEGGLDARAPEVRNAPVCRREASFEGSTTRNQTTPAAFEGNSRVRVQRRVLRRPTWTPARPRRGCREGEDGMKASPTDTLLRVVDYPMSNGKKLSMLNVICTSPYWRLSLLASVPRCASRWLRSRDGCQSRHARDFSSALVQLALL